MSSTTLKYYESTLAYQAHARKRRIKDFKKRFRTQISRRKLKQYIQQTLTRTPVQSSHASDLT